MTESEDGWTCRGCDRYNWSGYATCGRCGAAKAADGLEDGEVAEDGEAEEAPPEEAPPEEAWDDPDVEARVAEAHVPRGQDAP
eukprot:CAMPEP_0119287848 /NCGR_PEP_ID=MMETSP1329-20130426/36289_1 /TAXON_ID=114041 /ORGANISM="Genus nov. species nov., Strain RCC1024" /LENGTH=82 /DNA_ID=CAMNT_0007288621 /DNA_START=49 /DNA_END=294 /DNA_ORIENTATION=-